MAMSESSNAEVDGQEDHAAHDIVMIGEQGDTVLLLERRSVGGYAQK